MSYKHLPKQAQLFLNEYEEILASFDWLQDMVDKILKSMDVKEQNNKAIIKVSKPILEQALTELLMIEDLKDDENITFEWEN
ncbi:TPA: hypothetical protein ACNABL_004757 [Escherichia coli]